MTKKKAIKLAKKAAEQVLHLGWAFGALLPVFMWGPGIVTGALAGILLALPRELVDQWPINHWQDTALDLSFFGLGGALLGMFI